MEEEKYLRFWQKIAYRVGDFGSNFIYTFVSSFVLINLTDTVGLNAAIVVPAVISILMLIIMWNLDVQQGIKQLEKY